MNIICLIDSLGAGGAQRQLVGLASLLHNIGYRVKVVWYHSNSFYQYFLEEKGVEFEKLELNGKFDKLIKIGRCIKKFQTDIVISYLDGPSIIACLLRLFGMSFRLIVSERNTTQVLNLRERMKFYLYCKAHSIVANSHMQTNYVFRLFPFLRRKLTTITNFVDLSYFTPNDIKIENDNVLKILVIGRINGQKNIIRFLDAINIVFRNGYNIKVDWYGQTFEQRYNQACIKYLEKLGLEGRFQFHKESKDVLTLYHQTDVFCLPSLYEGFPNVICEAMACALPILCSNVCDNPRIVEDGKNGFLFNPLSAEDIAAKISCFIECDSVQKDQMRKHSRFLAEKNFSSFVFLESYNNLIKQLCMK